jgi:hypothetical protein
MARRLRADRLGWLAWAFMTLFRDSGLTSSAERGWLAIVLLLLAGAGAIALTPPRPARTQVQH